MMRVPAFGEFIADRRKRKGLSQFQLGKLVGVTDKAVSKWENNSAMPRLEHYIKLAEVLEFSLEDAISASISLQADNDAQDQNR